MQKITLPRPDDWHLHLRDGAIMAAVLPHTAQRFGRAIVMPNLRPPITTTRQATAYRERILAARPKGSRFKPLMTLYLTENTTPREITLAKQSGHVQAVKLYPAGATTHSEAGVRDITKVHAVLEAMAEQEIPLLVHGEVTDPQIDIFDREKVFIDQILGPLLERLPQLRVVFEHITTREAADFVRESSNDIAATITVHHLLLNRSAMLAGGIRPHHYCLPVPKRETHRHALIAAATSGSPRFFLGTDSAPHTRHTKESGCGCAGIYTAHAAIELYAELFEQAGALDRLAEFASGFGADFYRLPRNTDTITLIKESWNVPQHYPLGVAGALVPLRAGKPVSWRIANA